MNKTVAFIDAGFLRPSFARIAGRNPGSIEVDYAEVVHWCRLAARRLSSPLLRVYWYDGAYEPTHPQYAIQRKEFEKISDTPGIQVRLGHLQKRKSIEKAAIRKAMNELGLNFSELEKKVDFGDSYEQKGVDSLIVLDLVRLAQAGVYDTAILIASDRDLVEGVKVAQDSGALVVVARPGTYAISKEMARVCDELVSISSDIARRIVLERNS
ncbi:NYN domain-containing protein (plasmid) [Kitasatospora purpeofusca]|uniref:NYN domain-containing protein n=1 Tax=Kitasatospora purpeofusca TaxID=67352 RepID=UPI002E13C2D5|nr:NYN domain-containing protein [Kitasatospora purpeofusca]WSR45974.1 NYN domain-containing protein [Kitasatospora purpeofusca]